MVFLYAKLFAICREHVKHIKQLSAPRPQHLTTSDTYNNTNRGNNISLQMNELSPSGKHQAVSCRNSADTVNNPKMCQAQPHQTNQVSEHKAAITLGIIMGTFLGKF